MSWCMASPRHGVWRSPDKPKEVRMMLQNDKREARTVEAIENSDARERASHTVRPRPATGGGLIRLTFYLAFAPDLHYTVASKGSDNGSCTRRRQCRLSKAFARAAPSRAFQQRARRIVVVSTLKNDTQESTRVAKYSTTGSGRKIIASLLWTQNCATPGTARRADNRSIN